MGAVVNEVNSAICEYEAEEATPVLKFDDEDFEEGDHGGGGFEDPGKEDPGYNDMGRKRPRAPMSPFGPRTDEDPNKEPTPPPSGDGPQCAKNARRNIEKASENLIIVKESRKVLEGIAKGNVKETTFNAGMLAMLAASMGRMSISKGSAALTPLS